MLRNMVQRQVVLRRKVFVLPNLVKMVENAWMAGVHIDVLVPMDTDRKIALKVFISAHLLLSSSSM